MKMKWVCAVAVAVAMMCAAAWAESLPEDSGVFSRELAMEALTLCTGHTKENTAAVLKGKGYEVLEQAHFDKEESDPSHTCAFTIGKKSVEYGGETRTLLLVAIRGTSGGEWYSNFDVAPSRKEDTVFAENFMLCAEDVFVSLKPYIEAEDRPLILAAGHSRGAAAANLLGVLLDAAYDEKDVFVYTYATPNTVRGEMAQREYGNIFNIIHPCDLVPRLPMNSMGFYRAGTDLYLAGDAETTAMVDQVESVLSQMAGSLGDYYNKRHSLKAAGEAEDGMTAYEMMTMMGVSLVSGGSGGMGGAGGMGGMGQGSGGSYFSQESDFAPMFAMMARMAQGSGSRIFAYHMPQYYMQGLREMDEGQ